MKKTERSIFFYDLSIKAKSRHFDIAKPISVRKALELIALVPASQRQIEASNGRGLLYLSELKWLGDFLCLLIHRSDSSLSDPVFTNPNNHKRRIIKKEKGEGQDFSIHVLIQLPENDLNPALVLMESCIGLSAYPVKRLLNAIIGMAENLTPQDFVQNHPDGAVDNEGNPHTYKVSFFCELDGHLSNGLKYDLEHGKIDSIELITDQEMELPFDAAGYVTCKSRSILLKPELATSELSWFQILTEKLFPSVQKNFNRARIRFKTPTGVPRTVSLSTFDDLSNVYVRKDVIDGFDHDLASSYEHIHEPIVSKMIELLADDEND